MHILVGSVIFALTYLPALGLDWCVRSIDGHGFTQVLVYVMIGAKYFLVAVDTLLFGDFVIHAAVEAHKEMWS